MERETPSRFFKWIILAALAAVLVPAGPARAEDGDEALAKARALSFGIDYTLVTDYVWRGVNLSEYPGERPEDLNHQMTVSGAYDTGCVGTFSASIWFEWYAGQQTMAPGSDGNLQEVDYTVAWSYNVEPIFTTVEFGWIGYHFPQLNGDAAFTHEGYVTLSFDDGALLGMEQGFLNPYISYYLDFDDVRGSWLEWGISHDFALADFGLDNTPVLKDITLTPSFAMGIDHEYWSGDTRLANLLYGLDLTFDLGSAVGMPEEYGSLELIGFMRFSDAVFESFLNDEFWGGFTIAYGY